MVSMSTADAPRAGQGFSGPEAFISEPITPDPGTFATGPMSQGLVSLPAGFTWRNRHSRIIECIEHAKVTSPEGGRPGNEVYLRRQQFAVRLHTAAGAVLYFERHARRGGSRTPAGRHWFLLSIHSDDASEPGHGSE